MRDRPSDVGGASGLRTESSLRSLIVRAATAAFLIGVTLAISVRERAIGFAWAENDYLDHMDQIVIWAKRLWALGIKEAIRSLTGPFWEQNRYYNPHPPLFKYLGLLSRELFPFLGFPHAERLPSALMFAGACAAVFLALVSARGIVAGVVGGLSLATFPRLFGNAMFCQPDIPLAAAWVVAALAHERYETTKRRGWSVLIAVAVCAGLGCKISAILVLVPMAFLTVLWRRRRPPREILGGLLYLGAIGLCAVLFLILIYPFLWPSPFSRLVDLVQQAGTWSSQNPFTALFFGSVRRYPQLPWYFGVTIVALTSPPLTLLLALWGIARGPRDRLWGLAVTHLLFWLLLVILPNTPKYDNERQLLSLFPFLALLAGMGAGTVAEFLRSRLPKRQAHFADAAVGGLVAVVLVGELARAGSFPLSYYSPAVGGLPGAVRLGFEPTYAMEVLSRDVLEHMEQQIPSGSGLTVLPATAIGTFLQARGYLRPDLKLSTTDGPFFLMVNRHRVLWGLPARVKRSGREIDVYKLDGIPLVELWYRESPVAPVGDPLPTRGRFDHVP